jgi:hypothetical protein
MTIITHNLFSDSIPRIQPIQMKLVLRHGSGLCAPIPLLKQALSPLSTRFFPCFPPSCFLHVHIARRTVHSPHPLWHTCIQYAQSPGKLWSCWMHSGIRFLESSKLNDPECDGVLPLKWYRMQCQNWSKSFRARNMQGTLEGFWEYAIPNCRKHPSSVLILEMFWRWCSIWCQLHRRRS